MHRGNDLHFGWLVWCGEEHGSCARSRCAVCGAESFLHHEPDGVELTHEHTEANSSSRVLTYLGEDFLFLLFVLRIGRGAVLLSRSVPQLYLDDASLSASRCRLLFSPHLSIFSSSLFFGIRSHSRELSV